MPLDFQTIILSENTVFTSFFQSAYILYYFSYLTVLDRTTDTMLDGSGKRRHHCLVPNLRGKCSFFYHKDNVSCKIFIDAIYHIRMSPSQSSERFLRNGWWILWNVNSEIIEVLNFCSFGFSVLKWWITWIDFRMLDNLVFLW